MTVFQIIAILLTLAALGGYVNHRFMKLPDTIGHMAFALIVSLGALILGRMGWVDLTEASNFVNSIDFSDVVLQGMLSFLLFAGALHIDLAELKSMRWSVGILATVGVAISTFVTGTLVFYGAQLAGFELSYIYALLFGALISPTDPIAVLAILKKAGMSKRLYVKIGGESLFNDGVGVVVFLTILGIALSGQAVAAQEVAFHLAKEVMGGMALGAILGMGTFYLLRSIDVYKVEIMLTLALVAGGYALAQFVHVSAPISMVVAGLIIGDKGRKAGMSDLSRERLDVFWELVDDILNAVLFMLIGLELIVIHITQSHLVAGVIAIIAMLVGRWAGVGAPISFIRLFTPVERGTVSILTWGGLRGGLSIAMALSLPMGLEKDIIVPMTYLVVLFSILVQGLSFPKLLKRIG